MNDGCWFTVEKLAGLQREQAQVAGQTSCDDVQVAWEAGYVEYFIGEAGNDVGSDGEAEVTAHLSLSLI